MTFTGLSDLRQQHAAMAAHQHGSTLLQQHANESAWLHAAMLTWQRIAIAA
jgi:hypothetical protein